MINLDRFDLTEEYQHPVLCIFSSKRATDNHSKRPPKIT